MSDRRAEGVLITGVYGSGKSSVAQEIAYLLEQQGEPFALLDLDYLSWAGPDTGDRTAEIELMCQNLAAVTTNYRRAGIKLFVLAYFVRTAEEIHAIKEALGLPLKVARLTVPLAVIEQRLASDVTSGRRDDLREAAALDRHLRGRRPRGRDRRQRPSRQRRGAGSDDVPRLAVGHEGQVPTPVTHRCVSPPCSEHGGDTR